MKKFLYSDKRIFQIFYQLHKRGLALFLGFNPATGEPAIWMTDKSGLTKAAINIASAEAILDEITTLELEEFSNSRREVLIGEILETPSPHTITAEITVHRPYGRKPRTLMLSAVRLPG